MDCYKLGKREEDLWRADNFSNFVMFLIACNGKDNASPTISANVQSADRVNKIDQQRGGKVGGLFHSLMSSLMSL